MSDKPAMIVCIDGGRDITPLTLACSSSEINLPVHIVHNPSELHKVFQKNSIAYIVVAFTSDEFGEKYLKEFVDQAFRVLRPEDADLRIIYSTEGATPRGWPWPNLDPRPVKHFENNPVQTVFYDSDWVQTHKELKNWQDKLMFKQYSRSGIAVLNIDKKLRIPFPSEAQYLLRAAFKDMSGISITFPEQGLSGSIACFVRPVDSVGIRCKEVFVKIYNKHEKAQEEYNNALKYIADYIDYPRYDHYKRGCSAESVGGFRFR